jgi:hypothetical protein
VNENDEKKFGELMLAMGEVFQKIPNKIQMEIYFRALEDLTISQVSQAISSIVKTRKITGTLPLPAEIREFAGGNIEDHALVAWNKLIWALEYAGYGNSVAFDDPILMGAIQLWAGGWRKIKELDMTLDQIQWREKEFVKCYKAAARGQVEPPRYFPGDYEMENEARGFINLIPSPKFVTGKPGNFKMITGPNPKQLPDLETVKMIAE